MGFSGDSTSGSPDRGDQRGAPGSDDAYARGATDPETVSEELAEQDGGATSPPGDLARGSTTAGNASGGGAAAATDEQRERYLRLAAEYDNFRKRATRERQEAGTRAQGELVKQMIDALDDLARFAHVDPASTDPSTIVQGVEMVEKKMLKALGAAGLQVLNPVNQTFDPALHEAVSTEPALSREDDHVVSRVYQPGYVMGGQLLRPARVVVKQWNG
ncbi:MAG TPA: nucleotide exchange factor GrpE [Gemmatimonadaceae bacterium]|nr:nucleotide exchange factor GrpE [Gemmatimonadaceae bacterium]